MAKKPINVTIRKASSAPPSEVSRAGFRSITLYLPDALVDRLTAHARGQDLNVFVADVLEKHFAGLEQPPARTEDPVAALVQWARAKFAALRPAWLAV